MKAEYLSNNPKIKLCFTSVMRLDWNCNHEHLLSHEEHMQSLSFLNMALTKIKKLFSRSSVQHCLSPSSCSVFLKWTSVLPVPATTAAAISCELRFVYNPDLETSLCAHHCHLNKMQQWYPMILRRQNDIAIFIYCLGGGGGVRIYVYF